MTYKNISNVVNRECQDCGARWHVHKNHAEQECVACKSGKVLERKYTQHKIFDNHVCLYCFTTFHSDSGLAKCPECNNLKIRKREATPSIAGCDFYIERVPARTQEALQRYVQDGIEPGDFLKSVLTNNLHNAIAQADDENLQAIREIVMFVYNHLPSNCWGSDEIVHEYIYGEPEEVE